MPRSAQERLVRELAQDFGGIAAGWKSERQAQGRLRLPEDINQLLPGPPYGHVFDGEGSGGIAVR